ncbi:MAG: hypothetical protein H0U79_00115 [Solirubrobacterales bacterium]|nr:hypothetical protein [Solirubrobacterales bacterium]
MHPPRDASAPLRTSPRQSIKGLREGSTRPSPEQGGSPVVTWGTLLGHGGPVSSAASARPRIVVGVGASAGGVEALTALVGDLPAGLPAAVVVVLHVAATGRSVLADILDRVARLPVVAPVLNGDPEPGPPAAGGQHPLAQLADRGSARSPSMSSRPAGGRPPTRSRTRRGARGAGWTRGSRARPPGSAALPRRAARTCRCRGRWRSTRSTRRPGAARRAARARAGRSSAPPRGLWPLGPGPPRGQPRERCRAGAWTRHAPAVARCPLLRQAAVR